MDEAMNALERVAGEMRSDVGSSSSVEEVDPASDSVEVATPSSRRRLERPQPREDLPSVSDDDTIGESDLDEPVDTTQSSDPEADKPTSPGRRGRYSEALVTPSPSAARPSILRRSEVYSDPRFSSMGPRGKRPGLARWVVGIILVGLIGVTGFTLLKKHAPTNDNSQGDAQSDARIDKFLKDGEARLDEGDIEGAKDQFIKASGVAENEPRVARALARIEVIRADLLWLHLRLLEGRDADTETVHTTDLRQQLDRAIGRAKTATEHAAKQAPDDPLTIGLQVDVLRLAGKPDDARKLVAKLDSAAPEGGRALALLDLADSSPDYASVIDRLRSAARAEKKLGRARAMLVYALARAGNEGDAAKELAAIDGQALATPLRSALSSFVGKAPKPTASAEEPDAGAIASSKPVATRPKSTDYSHAEPFETAEPDLTDILPPSSAKPPASSPPDPPSPPSSGDAPPPPPPTATTPPTIDTSDLPPE